MKSNDFMIIINNLRTMKVLINWANSFAFLIQTEKIYTYTRLFLLFNNYENIHNPLLEGFQMTPLPLWIPNLSYTLLKNNLRSRPHTPLESLGERWYFLEKHSS